MSASTEVPALLQLSFYLPLLLDEPAREGTTRMHMPYALVYTRTYRWSHTHLYEYVLLATVVVTWIGLRSTPERNKATA